MLKKTLLAELVATGISTSAQAVTVDPLLLLNQGQPLFDGLAKDLSAASWMPSQNSAEPHSDGIIPVGFQVGVEVGLLSIDKNAAHWQILNPSGDASTLPIPKLRASLGIPFGLDVGISYLDVPSANLSMIGYEGRMAVGKYIPVPLLDANIRVFKSSLKAGSEISVESQGFAVMAGLDFPLAKPYVEFGTMKSTVTPNGVLGLVFNEVTTNESTYAMGVKVNLMLIAFNVEQAKIGSNDITTVKVAFEF